VLREDAVSGQEIVEPMSWVLGDAGQHVGQPSLRIDVIQ
jgi:hypothetical protein